MPIPTVTQSSWRDNSKARPNTRSPCKKSLHQEHKQQSSFPLIDTHVNTSSSWMLAVQLINCFDHVVTWTRVCLPRGSRLRIILVASVYRSWLSPQPILTPTIHTTIRTQLPFTAAYMSTGHQSAGRSTESTDNFRAIFKTALTEYQRATRKHLRTHPLATQLETCRSPKDVLDLLRTQAETFTKFQQSHERLMKPLDRIVHILFTFSAILGEGIGLVSCLIHPV